MKTRKLIGRHRLAPERSTPHDEGVSPELIAQVFERTQVGVVIHGPSAALTSMNTAAAGILGLAPSDLGSSAGVGSYHTLVDADGVELAPAAWPWVRVLATHEPVDHVEFGVRSVSGHVTFVEADAIAVSHKGETFAITLLVDASQRRDLFDAHHRLERRLELTATAGQVGLFEWDLDRGELWCDRGAGEIFGRPELVREPSIDAWFAAIHPDDRERVAAEFQNWMVASVDAPSTWRIIRPDGVVRTVLSRSRVLAKDGFQPTHLAGALIDVTLNGPGSWIEPHVLTALESAQRDLTDRLRAENTPNVLTGLPNRAALRWWLTEAMDQLRHRSKPVAVCLIDLDQLRLVNDSLGRTKGDEVVVEAALRIRALVQPSNPVCYIGDNEFAIASANLDASELAAVGDRVLSGILGLFHLAGSSVALTASAGIACTDHLIDPDVLIRDASAALQQAMQTGNRVVVFDEALRTELVHRLGIEADLHGAVERGELRLDFQPYFDLSTERVAGTEALVRWKHPLRGMVGPDEFIPVTERSDLILEVGEWVLRTACREASRRGETAEGPWSSVWVNASGRQLEQPGFAALVSAVLAETGLAPSRLGIEFTETALLHDLGGVAHTLHELADIGVRIAIDDFGTGYSSLSRLAEYPVDVLKIDRAFVAPLTTAGPNAIVAAIVELGHALGAVVCAEGIETHEQLDVLRDMGVDNAAGFLLAYPVRSEKVAATASVGEGVLADGTR